MSNQSPTSNSQGQGPKEPFDQKDETWSPEQEDQVTNLEDVDEGSDSSDFDEDETNPTPA
jgi:hypothetical protein